MPKNTVTDGSGFDAIAERARLTRLCRRWTGSTVVAEDLAQETLFIAWRRLQRGKPPSEWPSYLTGIARRLCLNWNARNRREESRLVSLDQYPELPLPVDRNGITHPPDPLDALISAEREGLIDRAVASLEASVREILIARYVDALPLAEIAGRLGLTENAATVRLHRSREALRKKLTTTLRAEAASLGLLDTDLVEGWQTTPIFCCRCGSERLAGRFIVAESGEREFSLRCPRCPGSLIGMTSQVVSMDSATLLSGVSGFRPALNRVNRWWQRYLAEATQRGTALCIACGTPASVFALP